MLQGRFVKAGLLFRRRSRRRTSRHLYWRLCAVNKFLADFKTLLCWLFGQQTCHTSGCNTPQTQILRRNLSTRGFRNVIFTSYLPRCQTADFNRSLHNSCDMFVISGRGKSSRMSAIFNRSSAVFKPLVPFLSFSSAHGFITKRLLLHFKYLWKP